jgi:hypothetical protein
MKPFVTKSLDWVDRRNDWQFLLIVYMTRWLVLSPILVLYLINPGLFPADGGVARGHIAVSDLAPILIVAPLFETLVECTLPYALLRKWVQSYRRPWLFIALSGIVMMALHPYVSALLPSFITGCFLAYSYTHFVGRSNGIAYLFTALFHAGINLVGVTGALLS